VDFADVDRSDPHADMAAEDDRCLTTGRPSDDECDPNPVEEEDEGPVWTPDSSCQCADCRREICGCDGCLFGGSCTAGKTNERSVA